MFITHYQLQNDPEHGTLIIPVILELQNLKHFKYLQVMQMNIEYNLSEHFLK